MRSLLAVLRRRALASSRPPVLLIDGRSGSGKTTLAKTLYPHLSRLWQGLELVSLDDYYPGWKGLAAGSEITLRQILESKRPGYNYWNWEKGSRGPRRDLPPQAPLLIEGCGSLTIQTRPLATFAIWVQASPQLREQRCLKRDQGRFGDHWQMWAEQEELHIARHDPAALADLIWDSERKKYGL